MTHPRRALSAAGELTEAAFQAQVIGLLRLYGWALIYHAPDGAAGRRTTGTRRVAGGQIPEGRGFPDVVAVKGHRLLVAELKTRTGRVDPRQADWVDAFRQVGRAVAYAAGVAMGEDLLEPNKGHTDDYRDVAVMAFLWRPADWPEIQRVIGAWQDYRPELDPVNQP